ncbi:septum formation initiator family protein [Treponema pedis]|uniref:Septum formation initiator family protein n=1 Tax=Treponema pedis TaxID=409322 RepID=A0A7S6WMC3_9SPIR|nr:septum formation initiator family protein [Treponema pedis]QOW59712.1 septum formation initiator family protein [Treponema pedis]QSI05082.1 septum formation initiator family protein [Treponema pedis]
MKIYFRVVVPVFITVLSYSILTLFFGAKGIYSKRFMEVQRDALIEHVNSLNKTGFELDGYIKNLTYNPETIAVYAHELGYIYENEGIIKLVNFNSGFGKTFNPGAVLKISKPHFLSDYVCKTIAVSMGIIAVIFEMFAVKKDAYSKRRG